MRVVSIDSNVVNGASCVAHYIHCKHQRTRNDFNPYTLTVHLRYLFNFGLSADDGVDCPVLDEAHDVITKHEVLEWITIYQRAVTKLGKLAGRRARIAATPEMLLALKRDENDDLSSFISQVSQSQILIILFVKQ